MAPNLRAPGAGLAPGALSGVGLILMSREIGRVGEGLLAEALSKKLTQFQVPQDCDENGTRPLRIQLGQGFRDASFDLAFLGGKPIWRCQTQKGVSR